MLLKIRFPIWMLSELDQVQFQLLRLVKGRQDFKGFVQPSPEIPMGKEIHPKQGYQIGKRPGEFGPKLEKLEDQKACVRSILLASASLARSLRERRDIIKGRVLLLRPRLRQEMLRK